MPYYAKGAILFSIDTSEMEAQNIELIGLSYLDDNVGHKVMEELLQYENVHYSF